MENNNHLHHRRSIRLFGYNYAQEGMYFITICCDNKQCFFGGIDNVGANNHSPIRVDDNLDNNNVGANVGANNYSPLRLNDTGMVAKQCWLDIPKHFPNAVVHEFIIMPNHIHGIIELLDVSNDIITKENINNKNTVDNDSRLNVDGDMFGNDDWSNDGAFVGSNDGVFVGANDGAFIGANDGAFIGANDGAFIGANDYSPLRFRSPSRTIGSIVRGFKIGVTKWCRKNTDIDVVWQRNYYEHIIRNDVSYQTIAEYILTNPDRWKGDKFYLE